MLALHTAPVFPMNVSVGITPMMPTLPRKVAFMESSILKRYMTEKEKLRNTATLPSKFIITSRKIGLHYFIVNTHGLQIKKNIV